MLRFSDGMTFDTDGELRIVRKSDGLYVVGEGMMVAVDSAAEGRSIIDERKDRRRRRCGTCGRRLTTAQEKSDGYCERCREDAIDHGALSGEVR